MLKSKLPAVTRSRVTLLASTISAILGTNATHQAFAQQPAQPEEVVVTGSRIVRRDLDAASPIMTVDTQRLESSSTLSVESILNQMPQFNPAQGQFSAQGEIQTSPTGALGIGSVNLRGIGTNRTLVLIDGRRAQPATASLVVDLNTIPSAAIARVETITGGASAVYGADAIAGVVNFVLKDNYEGASFDVQTGATQAGGGEETRFSGLLGMNGKGGNANMLLGVEWYTRGVSFQKDRDFFKNGWNDPKNPASTFFPSMAGYALDANNLPSQAALDSLLAQSGVAPGTVSRTRPGLNIFYNKNGTPFARGGDGVAFGFDNSQLNQPFNGDGFYGLHRNADGTLQQIFQDGALSSPLTRRSIFGKAHVDINDHLRAFVQANFARADVQTYSAGPPPAVGASWGGAIPNDGRAAVPASLTTLLNSRARDPDGAGPLPVGAVGSGASQTWVLNRGLDFLGQFGPLNSSEVYQVMAGLQGSMANRDWTWEVYYSSGATNATNVYYGLPSVQQWKALVASPEFGKGQTINYSTDANGAPVLDQNGNRIPLTDNYQITCASGLPIFFGTTAGMTPDCTNGLLGHWKSLTDISQDIFEGTLQGKLVDMKSGELRFSVGASHRRNAFTYEPSNPQSSTLTKPLGLFVSNASSGESSVSELFGELLVPITKRLDLDAGYRWSDYSTGSGQVGTYKVEVNWAATKAMRVRASVQRANRAPNVAELFQSDTTAFETTFANGDPCAANTTAPWGNVASNPNRLAVQTLCAALIGNTTSSGFGAPGSNQANTYLAGTTPFTGINGIQQGNPKLDSEAADTYSVGLVFRAPGGLKGLTASVDIYNIKITDAIAAFNGFQIYSRCLNADGKSNPTYSANDPGGFCALTRRDSGTGGLGTVVEQYLNAGIIETTGVDISANWTKDLKSGGSLYVDNMLTYLDKFDTQTTPTDPVLHYKGTLGGLVGSGGAGQFDYRLNTTFGYRFGGGKSNVGLRMRYLPEVKNAAYVTAQNTPILPTKAYSEFDMFAGYDINEKFQLRGGIDNLLDTDPAVVGATPTDTNSASTLATYYDTLGRRVYVGFKMQF